MALGQQKKWSSSDIQIQLEKLNVLGTVLYFAAHPDDENTRLIAWLAREKKYKTAYLSLTRGEGGQNLIGTDLGVDLGLIRTNELLAARDIDRGEQFFSSALDFGFSKTHEETFKFWDKDQVLAEAVYLIRKLRPDVIINRFPPDRRGGHGHHQASAILAHEAFVAAADPTRFPEQLNEVTPWQATRLLWNTANFGGMNNTSNEQLQVNIGHYNPLLGQSYGEIAAKSRSQHKSQGFGAAATRGHSIEYFEHVAGKRAKTELMDDVVTDWNRISGTAEIQALIQQINNTFSPNHPEQIVDDLLALRRAVAGISDEYWKTQKLKEIDELIIACTGLWVDAVAGRPTFALHQEIPVQVEVIVRNPKVQAHLVSVEGQTVNETLRHNVLWKGTHNTRYSETTQPYWLKQPHSLGMFTADAQQIGEPLNTEKPSVNLVFQLNGEEIPIKQDIAYRFVDPVQGEVYQPIAIQPALTIDANQRIILLSKNQSKELSITFQNNADQDKKYTVEVISPEGWEVSPKTIDLDFTSIHTIPKTIHIKQKGSTSKEGVVRFQWNGQDLTSIKNIHHDHIPAVTWFPTLEIVCRPLDIINPVKKIGYVVGAGDLIPQALRNIDMEVNVLNPTQIQRDNLRQFDAVVVGVRFFNVYEKSAAIMNELLHYVEQGGVVLVQYNVNTRLQSQKLGPYPFNLTRDRVTEEDALVDFDEGDPAFNFPNKITSADFAGWVQERGLYFATQIDEAYRTPIKMHDTDEAPHQGSLLITRHGQGKFVYTSLSFFRQLPAGVPGAYRLFVNLLANEK